MRIGYIAPYQGPDLVQKRPSLHNLSLAARVKIQLIAGLLQSSSHEVEIISQGPVDGYQLRFYPALPKTDSFHPEIPVSYLSALPVRFLCGWWEGFSAERLLKERHARNPYDLLIVYNLKRAQLRAAHYAVRHLGIPVILEYEDDVFVDVQGRSNQKWLSNRQHDSFRETLKLMSGVMAPSPYLLSQCPDVPQLLIRAVVSPDILKLRRHGQEPKKNWVVFSGTLEGTQGLEQTVKAWHTLQYPGWELHIAGQGALMPSLQKLAEGNRSIVFHGLLNRQENASLLCAARIGLNAQDVSQTLGNVFAFKIIEYLAAGNHVITTPRGKFEPELEAGVTYIRDNSPEAIAACLKQVIREQRSAGSAEEAAVRMYGPETMSRSLNSLLDQIAAPPKKQVLALT